MLVSLLAACTAPAPLECGDGTHEDDGACVADSDTGLPDSGDADADTDTDADSDTDADGDTDADSDSDADSDTDTGIAPWACEVAADGTAAFTDIQPAIDAATDGSTIRVCAGQYSAVELRGRTLTLVGEDRDSTIVKGSSSASALSIQGGTVAFGGFTLSGSSTSTGAAIDMSDGTATLSDVLITATSAPIAVWQHDGDLLCQGVDVRENAGNSGNTLVAIAPDASVEWAQSWFSDNTDAGTVFFAEGRTEFHNNILARNTFRTSAAVFSTWNSGGQLVHVGNNVFYDHQADNDPASRVVLSVGGDNSFAYGNIVQDSNAIGIKTDAASTTSDVSWNLTWDTSAGADLGGSGNLEQDARFTAADTDDFTLDALSPAINAGNPDDGADDLDGTANDMGAYGGPAGGW